MGATAGAESYLLRSSFLRRGHARRSCRNLRQIVELLAAPVAAAVPVLVLEPSCLSLLRDEMRALLPGDARADQPAKSCVTMAEFARNAGLSIAESDDTFVHEHCHQRACGGAAEKAIGANLLDTGCCGMAGAFGYHEKTAQVSIDVANRELLLELATLGSRARVVADGFGSRSQIGKPSGLRPKHLAEVFADQLDGTGGS